MTDDPSDIATRSPRRTAPRFASFENEDSADYFVFVDELVLTQTDGFAKGLNLWFISHYIFNLRYEKQVQEVALFFQEYIWNLSASADIHEYYYLIYCEHLIASHHSNILSSREV